MIKNRTRLALVLSAVVHTVLALVLWFQPTLAPRPKHQTEVELLTPEQLAQMIKNVEQQKDKGQIVDQSEKALNDEIPENSKYLSRHNQVVQRQTVAAAHGRFENTDAMGGRPQEQKREIQKPKIKQREIVTNENGLPGSPDVERPHAKFQTVADRGQLFGRWGAGPQRHR